MTQCFSLTNRTVSARLKLLKSQLALSGPITTQYLEAETKQFSLFLPKNNGDAIFQKRFPILNPSLIMKIYLFIKMYLSKKCNMKQILNQYIKDWRCKYIPVCLCATLAEWQWLLGGLCLKGCSLASCQGGSRFD